MTPNQFVIAMRVFVDMRKGEQFTADEWDIFKATLKDVNNCPHSCQEVHLGYWSGNNHIGIFK